MIYEYLFRFFDSVPTGTFIVWFTCGYFLLHALAFRLLLQNAKFRSISYDKQTSILINVMESLLLSFMR